MRPRVIAVLALFGGCYYGDFRHAYLDGGGFDPDAFAPDGTGQQECTSLATVAPDVVGTDESGTAPSATGGAITNGTYVLIQIRRYGTPGAAAIRETLGFTGVLWERSYQEAGSDTDLEAGGTVVFAGSFISLTTTCGAPAPKLSATVTSDPTTGIFSMIIDGGDHTIVNTYQRQP